MTIERNIAAAFHMSDTAWQRHANPWSVWTRFTVLPILVLSLWSRTWIGSWCLVPIAVALIWTWLNPHLFPKPDSTDNWASKAVLGERVWLNRDQVPVPNRHAVIPHVLSVVSALGVGFLAWGLWALAIWPIAFGVSLIYFGKLWFLDRMVWLYEDMKDQSPQYQQWLY